MNGVAQFQTGRPGSALLSVFHHDYMRAVLPGVSIVSGRVNRFDVTLRPGACITGAVRSPEGSLVGAPVRLIGRRFPEDVQDDGGFEACQLEPGRPYELEVLCGRMVGTARFLAPAADVTIVVEGCR